MLRHYVYQHIRLDTHEIFYIGIGSKKPKYKTEKESYARAYSKVRRNKFWKNIVQKTDYRVEIIVESSEYDEVKKKEIELIQKYGCRDIGKGPLVNLTDGGEGLLNIKAKLVDVYVYDKYGMFIDMYASINEASEKTGVAYSQIYRALYENRLTAKNKIFLKEYAGKSLFTIQLYRSINKKKRDTYDRVAHNAKPIIQMTKEGKIIREWNSAGEAGKELGISAGNIGEVCKGGNRKQANGYMWKYK